MIVIAGAPGSGKTTVGMALGRWLQERGVRSAPLHLSRPGAWDTVHCAEGGLVSWPCALLSEACGVVPEPAFEAGLPVLGDLQRRFETVLVEAGLAVQETDGAHCLDCFRDARGWGVHLNGSRIRFRRIEPMACLNEPDAAFLQVPRWRPGAGPRIAIVSLPHLDDFAAWAAIRGAEWLTVPGVGRFDVLFVPDSLDPGSDAGWLDDTGLADWLKRQAGAGVRVISTCLPVAGAERVPASAIRQPGELARFAGVRWPDQLPREDEIERLAKWLEASAGEDALRALLP